MPGKRKETGKIATGGDDFDQKLAKAQEELDKQTEQTTTKRRMRDGNG